DCYLKASSTTLSANASGQILEDYNFIPGSGRTNVTTGVHSSTITNLFPLISFGQERIWGGQPRPFGAPARDTPQCGWGAQISPAGPSVDMLNRPRPAGTNRVMFTGTATSGGATTLTDSGAAWG